jgi:hypothetical protein
MRIGSLLFPLLLLLAPDAIAQIRFESPDSALAYYIKSANARDLAGINATFLEPVTDFNFYGPPVERFSVVKRTRYTEKHVRNWKRKGIIGPVAVGDLQLDVRQVVVGKSYMYSYHFRETASGWKIVDASAWDQ